MRRRGASHDLTLPLRTAYDDIEHVVAIRAPHDAEQRIVFVSVANVDFDIVVRERFPHRRFEDRWANAEEVCVLGCAADAMSGHGRRADQSEGNLPSFQHVNDACE